MKNILIEFGTKVKNLRIAQGLTQQQLADKSGLHKNYIGMVERGERNPSLKNIETIAMALGVSISQLMDSL